MGKINMSVSKLVGKYHNFNFQTAANLTIHNDPRFFYELVMIAPKAHLHWCQVADYVGILAVLSCCPVCYAV